MATQRIHSRQPDDDPPPKLHGALDYPTWKPAVQNLLESKDLWKTTTGEDSKPAKPKPPAHDACWVLQSAYQDACAKYMRRLRAWEEKSTYAYSWIATLCTDAVREWIVRHEYGEVAWRMLEEIYEPIDTGEAQGMIFKDLASVTIQEGQTMGEFAEQVDGLAVKCLAGGCGVPQWMLCIFFRVGLELQDEEEEELRAEEARKRVELGLRDMVVVLKGDKEQVARRS